MADAYLTRLEQRELIFSALDGLVRDCQTPNSWDAMARAVEGPIRDDPGLVAALLVLEVRVPGHVARGSGAGRSPVTP